MSLAIALQLRNKRVLVVGGGKVAYRKVRQFYNEQAKVTVIAPCIEMDIKNLGVECIERNFQTSDIKEFDLVYTATNDIKLNEEIVKICNQLHIFCGSATECAEVGYVSLQQEKLDHGMIAISTNNLAPLMTKEMVSQFKEVWNVHYLDKLNLLFEIQEMISNSKYKLLRKMLSSFSYLKLCKVKEFLIKGKVVTYLYHGTNDEQLIKNDFPEFLEKLKHEEYVKIGCVFASHVQTAYKNNFEDEFTLQEIQLLSKVFDSVEFFFEIMTMAPGYFYQKLYTQCDEYGHIFPFWFNDELLEEYVVDVIKKHPNQTCVFVSHDKNERIQSICEKYGALSLKLNEDIEDLSQDMHIEPMFMIKGKHMKEDVLYGEHSLCSTLKEKNISFTCDECALIQKDWVIDVFKNHLK